MESMKEDQGEMVEWMREFTDYNLDAKMWTNKIANPGSFSLSYQKLSLIREREEWC